MKTSIIVHPPKISLVIIRADYLGICENSPDKNCSAAILNLFEFWMNVKLDNRPQAKQQNESLEKGDEQPTQDTELWVWKKMSDIQDELFNIWKEDKIRSCRKWLEEQEFLLKRRNPKHGWDKTLQYKLNVGQVQMSVNRWFRESNPENSGLDSGNIRERLLEILDSDPENSASNTIDYLQRLLDIGNIQDEFIPPENSDGVNPPDDTDPKYKLIDKFLGIYWSRFVSWYKKKHNVKPAKSQDAMRQVSFKKVKSIVDHELDFTVPEFIQTLEHLRDSEWYVKNGQFPSWDKIAGQIPITVQELRGMTKPQGTKDVPKNRFSD